MDDSGKIREVIATVIREHGKPQVIPMFGTLTAGMKTAEDAAGDVVSALVGAGYTIRKFDNADFVALEQIAAQGGPNGSAAKELIKRHRAA